MKMVGSPLGSKVLGKHLSVAPVNMKLSPGNI